ncbi:stage III sporulation protein AD [Proteinivorax hydrogeniformans]|uniref:Stage III sporulation protein AD n=1 Tax=Proteinivorax hydrogeniformans TaxID=1826727 RepID=A0AAU8HX88_9FIRM
MSIVAFGIVASIIIVIIKQQKPEIAMQLALAAGALIFLAVISQIYTVVRSIEEMAYQAELNVMFLGTMLRIIGIAYITEFGSQVCKDAGQGAVASKVEFAGKIMMLLLALPIISMILQTLVSILP